MGNKLNNKEKMKNFAAFAVACLTTGALATEWGHGSYQAYQIHEPKYHQPHFHVKAPAHKEPHYHVGKPGYHAPHVNVAEPNYHAPHYHVAPPKHHEPHF